MLAETICPPMIPIGLEGFPGRLDIRDTVPEFELGGFEVAAFRSHTSARRADTASTMRPQSPT